MTRKRHLTAFATVLFAAGVQLVSMPGSATVQSQKWQDTRDTRQEGRQDGS